MDMSRKELEYFGLDETATVDDLEVKRREKLSEVEKSEVGEKKKKDIQAEIEANYISALEYINSKSTDGTALEGTVDVFMPVRKALKAKNISEAQSILDGIDMRDGEWHYHQAMIYYEQNWQSESKKQLEIAMSLEPMNTKYRQAYDKLCASEIAKTAFGNEEERQTKTERTYSPNQGMNGDRGRNVCCGVCQGLICADCCCECLGGDLLPC